MSWIIATECFNGVLCAGDIQTTIKIPEREDQYFNCVKKIHKIYDNLVVGFAGDIKVGLLMIEKIKVALINELEEDRIFDLDGQTENFINRLQCIYDEIIGYVVGDKKFESDLRNFPFVELIFCWVCPDEEGKPWMNYRVKFTSPNFKRFGEVKTQVAIQLGSGTTNPKYQEVLAFLTGDKKQRNDKYSKIYGEYEQFYMTIEKYKNDLIKYSENESFNGVSKSFYSMTFTTHWNKLYPNAEEELKDLIDLKFVNVYDYNGTKGFSFNLEQMKKTIINEEQLLKFKTVLERANNQKLDLNSFVEFPIFNEEFYHSEKELISEDIASTWPEFVSIMKKKRINMGANASAIG